MPALPMEPIQSSCLLLESNALCIYHRAALLVNWSITNFDGVTSPSSPWIQIGAASTTLDQYMVVGRMVREQRRRVLY